MYVINMDKIKGYKSIVYPDGQPHVKLDIDDIYDRDVMVICSITDATKLLLLCEVADALTRIFTVTHTTLYIPYLMGARFDRVMQPGDSFDLKVITKIVNSLKFNEVQLYDVHSDVSTALIENSYSYTNEHLVRNYNLKNSILIVPDAGAAKKAPNYLEWNKNIVNLTHCIKHRDLSNGAITLKVLEPEKCFEANCVIIDDICDGGGTFLQIAKQIKPKNLTLIVTHGIFSKGFDELSQYFNEIIVSDSYPFKGESKIVKLIHI